MRFVIFSDIHANLEALLAVVADVEKKDVVKLGSRDKSQLQFISLGDVIGYGPRPNESMDIIRGLAPDAELIGNHEQGVFFAQQFLTWKTLFKKHWFEKTQNELQHKMTRGQVKDSYDCTNLETQWILRWTAENLSLKNSKHVSEQVIGEKYVSKEMRYRTIFSHANPIDPAGMAYISPKTDYHQRMISPTDVMNNIGIKGVVNFVGHSHKPGVYARNDAGGLIITPVSQLPENVFGVKRYDLAKFPEAVIIVGSIGQPRNYDPRAQYAVYDSETRMVEFRFVKYEVLKTQIDMGQRMRGNFKGHTSKTVSYPLIERLEDGK